MQIYEGYFNDVEQGDLATDIEQSSHSMKNVEYQFKMYIKFGISSYYKDEEISIPKIYARLLYILSNTMLLSEFFIDDKVVLNDVHFLLSNFSTSSAPFILSELGQEINHPKLEFCVHFNIDNHYKTDDVFKARKSFYKFLDILKYQVSKCCPYTFVKGRMHVESIVQFCYENGDRLINSAREFFIGNIRGMNDMYNKEVSQLFCKLFDFKDSDATFIENEVRLDNNRQKAFTKAVLDINNNEDVAKNSIEFKPVKVVMDSGERLWGSYVHYISLELHSTNKKVKKIHLDEIGKIITEHILNKIPFNVDKLIGGYEIIIKPVNITVDMTDFWGSKYIHRFQVFGNSRTGAFGLNDNSNVKLVITRKDGTTIEASKVSSMYNNVCGIINLGQCWKKQEP